jgi:rare lipoprotein A
MFNKNLFSMGMVLCLVTLSSCTKLFRKEDAPPPRPIKSGLMSPAEGTPIGEPWAQSIGEGVYKVGKPYKVNGVWYFPKEDYNYDEVGYASWYGPDFHNKRTANGEVFDMNMLSAAHKTLPLPSVIRVTNLQNGRSLILRVNDRGPFVNDRILDVSKKGAQLLGFKDQGTTKVRVELLPEESMTVASLAQNANYIKPEEIKPVESGEIVVTNELKSLQSFGDPDEKPVGRSLPGGTLDEGVLFDDQPLSSLSRKATEQASPVMSEDDYNRQLEESLKGPAIESKPEPSFVQERAAPLPQTGKQFFVQAGAFSRVENAEKTAKKLASVGQTCTSKISTSRGDLYKVQVGPFSSNFEARQAMKKVAMLGHPDAHVVG